MKKIILSAVVASMALTTAASAIENVKANGMAKFIYQATDNNLAANDSLFGKTTNNGQAGLHMGMSADLSTNLSGAFEVQSVSTLGLENSLVSGVMATNVNVNANGATGEAATDDQFWISQAYFTYKMNNTVAKVGLQELNTPLAFTEKWNVVNNTFQAIVAVNNDIKDVTLVGAYVGKGNGGTGGQSVSYDGKFSSYSGNGAYAAGAIAKIGEINAQAWYYNVQLANAVGTLPAASSSNIRAYWLEADTKVSGVFLGAQYAGTDYDGQAGESINAWALKAGTDIAGVHVFGAISSVGDEAKVGGTSQGFANTATGDKTKLYTGTGSIYADGAVVATEDTDAWKIGASTKIADIALAANYTDVDYGNNAGTGGASGAINANGSATAWDVSAGTKVGPVALKAIYTQFEAKPATGANTFDRDTLRIIASAKF
jgi:hypothetical protein